MAPGGESEMAASGRFQILSVFWVLQERAKMGCVWIGQSWLRKGLGLSCPMVSKTSSPDVPVSISYLLLVKRTEGKLGSRCQPKWRNTREGDGGASVMPWERTFWTGKHSLE